MIKKIKDNRFIFLFVVFMLFFAIYIFFKNKTSTTKIIVQEKEIEEEPAIEDIIKQIENKKKEIKKKCKIKENKYNMNGSKCQSTKVDLCKLGSYKQCTNNKKPIFKSCDCHEANSILCDDTENISEKCLHDFKVFDMKTPFKDNKENTRVNMFHSTKKTVFDKLK